MIAKISKGRGFRGLLNYLDGKDGSERLAGSVVGVTPRAIAQEFGLVRRLKPDLERAVFHLSLRPPQGEILSNEQWAEAAERAIERMGFEDSPWVAYLHREGGEAHLHLVASRVTYDGRVVSESNDFKRSHEVAREIERELGLTVVAPAPSDRRSPSQAEVKREARTGEVSVRGFLQEEIGRAAAERPTFSVFLERLRAQSIEAAPAVTSRGRLVGISYRYEGHAFSGSALGRAFTWNGLRERFGLRLDPERDLPALFAAARAVGRAASPSSSQSSLSPSHSNLPQGQQEVSMDSPNLNLTSSDSAIRRQLLALGGDRGGRFDLLIVDAAKGTAVSRSGWDLDQVLKAAPWLRHENAQGREILVKPVRPSQVVVLELSLRELDRGRARGLDPAAVVGLDGSSSDHQISKREAWFRFAEPLDREQFAVGLAKLAERFEVRATEPSEYGHLAGFRSYLGVDREQATWVQLERASGVVFERAAEIQAEIAPRVDGRTVEAPAIDLAEVAREVPPSAPRTVFDSPEPESTIDPVRFRRLSLDYERAVEVHFEAQQALTETRRERLAQPSFDLEDPLPSRAELWTERHVVETYRTSRSIEREVEDRLGVWPLPESDTFEQSVNRAIEFATEARKRERAPFELLSDSEIYRERLDPQEILKLGHEALDRAQDLAGAGPWERGTGLALEENRFDLERALAATLFEHERISLGVERLEARLDELDLGVGSTADSDRLREFLVLELHSLSRLDPVLDDLRFRVAEAQLLAIDRDLGRWVEVLRAEPSAEGFREVARLLEERNVAVERFEGRVPLGAEEIQSVAEVPQVRAAEKEFVDAARAFAAAPSPTRFEELRDASGRFHQARRIEIEVDVNPELRAARQDLVEVQAKLRTAGPRATEIEAQYREAFDRFLAAEDRLAAHVRTRPSLGSGDRLGDLLGRVRQGDLTPETLARLHRELAAEIARTTGSWPRLSAGRAASLGSRGEISVARSAAAWSASRGRLFDELRGFLGREGRPSPVDVERLREAVGAYQLATRRLSLSLDRGLEGRLEPAGGLLASLRGIRSAERVREAAGVWARQAAALGQSAESITRQLSRSAPRSPIASLSPFGHLGSRSIATSAVGLVRRYLIKKVREMVHER